MPSCDIVASFSWLFPFAYTYIVSYWYIKYHRQVVIQAISTLFPAANMIFSMKPPSDCCSHRDHVSLCFTPPTQVWDKNVSIYWIHLGDDLDDDQKGCWWSGVEMDRSHWWQGMDRRDCQTRTANDVPNVPVNLALSSN